MRSLLSLVRDLCAEADALVRASGVPVTGFCNRNDLTTCDVCEKPLMDDDALFLNDSQPRCCPECFMDAQKDEKWTERP